VPSAKSVENFDDANGKWSHREITAARELLDFIAAELAEAYIETMRRGLTAAPTNADSVVSTVEG
jgi:hypothetical protein